MNRRVAVITGTRAEFGLLLPVMRAIDAHPKLGLSVIVTGTHLLPPAETHREVAEHVAISAKVAMQCEGDSTRLDESAALGRGITGLARVFQELRPHWVVVLGDRIEALAGACAASVGGIALAHIHGGDRAEGVADEAMRHAITKLAHLHLPATQQSAERIGRMGEREDRVHVVGSPAIDMLDSIGMMDDAEVVERFGGAIEAIMLLHPAGLGAPGERNWAHAAVGGLRLAGVRRALLLAPNHDADRAVILDVLQAGSGEFDWPLADHLPRATFLSLLRRMAESRRPLVGNSSAGLIEAAALGVPVVNLGRRQEGRERAGQVIDVEQPDAEVIGAAIRRLTSMPTERAAHPYGDGRAGMRIAALLGTIDPLEPGLLRKRNTY